MNHLAMSKSATKKFDIEINQGAQFKMVILFTDCDGNPIDLSESTFSMQIKSKANDAAVIATVSAVKDADEDHKLNLTLSAAETDAIPVGAQVGPNKIPATYAYDLLWGFIEVGSGDAIQYSRPLEGLVNVSPKITGI